MNKGERDLICGLIARWEWQQGGGSSEAAARANCARDLTRGLALTDDDLSFSRAWEIARLMGIQDNEAMLDALVDKMETVDYSTFLDDVGHESFEALRGQLEASLPPPQGSRS